MQKPKQALKSVKGPVNTFEFSPKWSRTLPSLIYFSWDINRDPPPSIKKIKYQSWYLTPCCGLEVQKPTHAIKSVKGPGNTFDWSPKWARTLPSLIYFSWDIYRDPLHKMFQILKLIFDTLLWAWGTETHTGTSVSKRPGQYLWPKSQVVKNFAVLNICFMGYS